MAPGSGDWPAPQRCARRSSSRARARRPASCGQEALVAHRRREQADGAASGGRSRGPGSGVTSSSSRRAPGTRRDSAPSSWPTTSERPPISKVRAVTAAPPAEATARLRRARRRRAATSRSSPLAVPPKRCAPIAVDHQGGQRSASARTRLARRRSRVVSPVIAFSLDSARRPRASVPSGELRRGAAAAPSVLARAAEGADRAAVRDRARARPARRAAALDLRASAPSNVTSKATGDQRRRGRRRWRAARAGDRRRRCARQSERRGRRVGVGERARLLAVSAVGQRTARTSPSPPGRRRGCGARRPSKRRRRGRAAASRRRRRHARRRVSGQHLGDDEDRMPRMLAMIASRPR